MAINDTATKTMDARGGYAGLRDGAAGQLSSLADNGKSQLIDIIDGLVQAAEEFAVKLHDGAGGPVADIARSAVDTLGDWRDAIDAKSVEEILDDGRDLIRSQPVLAIGISIAAGFALARVLKAAGGGQ